jgi:hypothetical protein
MMKLAARKEAVSVGWYMEHTIGVMAEAICMLLIARERRSNNDNFHAQMTVLIDRVEEFFWGILELGIEDLYQGAPRPFNQLESQC